MGRLLYLALVSLHPRPFRERFGPEMIEIFDQEVERGMGARLLIDAAASVIRQRFLRMPAPEPLVTGGGFAYASGEPVFRTLDEGLPRRRAFASGAIVSTILLLSIAYLASHGSVGLPGMSFGAKYPRPSALSVDRGSIQESDATTQVKIPIPQADPLEGLARMYYEVVRVLKALDVNRDLTISQWEMVTAGAPLRRLDRNGDTVLDAEECGLSNYEGDDPQVAVRVRIEFMKANPVLKALDADGNGVISFPEIDRASMTLRQLDKNGDGGLSPAEVLPERVDRRAVMILSQLDLDRDRILSRDEWSGEKAAAVQDLLRHSDRDGDGIITEAELSRELRLRDETRRIEERARRTTGR